MDTPGPGPAALCDAPALELPLLGSMSSVFHSSYHVEKLRYTTISPLGGSREGKDCDSSKYPWPAS